MDSKSKQIAPDVPQGVTETTFAAELEFHLKTQGLSIRSRCSTIMLESILLASVKEVSGLSEKPLPEDGVVFVNINYDMKDDKLVLNANAPRMVVTGVLAHAMGAVTRNQTAQNFAVYKQAMETRVQALEGRMGTPKIILPGG